jgi:hypothetical protein
LKSFRSHSKLLEISGLVGECVLRSAVSGVGITDPCFRPDAKVIHRFFDGDTKHRDQNLGCFSRRLPSCRPPLLRRLGNPLPSGCGHVPGGAAFLAAALAGADFLAGAGF